MNLPLDSDVLVNVLAELEFDDLWDLKIPSERAMFKSNEPRYLFSRNLFDKIESTEGTVKATAMTSEKKLGKNQLMNSPSNSSADANIKLENPEWLELKKHIDLIANNEPKLLAQVTLLNKLKHHCAAMGTTESMAKQQECEEAVKTVQKTHESCLAYCSQFKFVKKDNLVDIEAMMKKVKVFSKEAMDKYDAVKAKTSRIKTWADSV